MESTGSKTCWQWEHHINYQQSVSEDRKEGHVEGEEVQLWFAAFIVAEFIFETELSSKEGIGSSVCKLGLVSQLQSPA